MKNGNAGRLFAALLGLVVLAPAAVAGGKPKVEQKVVLVKGNQEATNSGYTLGPRDRVTLSVAGKVCFSAGAAPSCVGPGGWGRADYPQSWPDDWNFCADPVETEAHAALLVDVDGERWPTGDHTTFSGKAGLLYFVVNDCSLTGEYSNTGQYSVVVKVERDAVPQP
ncbi:MAG TPA: hypothetical protein PLS53_09970 [Thermoanaerobaculaceae bacterium]|nr:hypothetical protein [Thermoanaerobaculaceae bacterium]